MSHVNEQWLPVPIKPYDEFYEVSNDGRVRRSARGGVWDAGRYLKLRNVRGYKQVVLSHTRTTRSIIVHRLVALAFIPNPEDLPIVNHINGIRDDNRVDNLEWVTHAQNSQHSIVILGNSLKRPRRGLSEQQLIQMVSDRVFWADGEGWYASDSKQVAKIEPRTGSVSYDARILGLSNPIYLSSSDIETIRNGINADSFVDKNQHHAETSKLLGATDTRN